MSKKKRKERKAKKAAWQTHKQELRIDAEVQRRFERLPLQVLPEAQERACGGCTACCLAVAVHELAKPTWTPCEHQCATGCAIYDQRPHSCRTYYCLWQAGMLKDEANRPDKLGIIFDFRAEGDVDAISAWELWEGAADSPKVEQLINAIMTQINSKVIIIIRRFKSSKRRVIGRAELLEDLKITECN